VERALEVDVTALGADGTPVAFSARGWQARAAPARSAPSWPPRSLTPRQPPLAQARILQHEYDHLQGTLYIDRMATRSFRRVDLIAQPLPGPSPEFGVCPPLGVQSKGFGGGGGSGGGGGGGGGFGGKGKR
jgi:peptide deformylase